MRTKQIDEPRARGRNAGPRSHLVLFDNGFRPLFLMSGLWAMVGVGLWTASLATGWFPEIAAYDGLTWHIHEMLFGFGGAAIGGFLLTAVPNWTGGPPVAGGRLMILVAAWLLARVVALTGGPLPPVVLVLGDNLYFILLFAMTTREIWIGKSKRNYPVALLLGLLTAANILFHAEALGLGADLEETVRGGVVHPPLLLIAVIGGRICPTFTANWMKRQGLAPLPIPFNRFDALTILVLVIAIVSALATDYGIAASYLLAGAGGLHLIRLFRWRGFKTFGNPIVFVLHLGYGWLGFGYLLLGLSGLSVGLKPAEAVHALTAGAMGVTILGVMTRATLGHTGREIKADIPTVWAYGLVAAAAVFRVLTPLLPMDSTEGYGLSAVFWIVGFGLFLRVYAPMLLAGRNP